MGLSRKNLGRVVCGMAAVGLLAAAARGAINPRFTPVELVKTSSMVLVLKVGAPQGKAMAAEVLDAAKGQAPKDLKLEIGPELKAEEIAAAFGGGKSTTAVLAVFGGEDNGQAGAIQIQTQWFAVSLRQGVWRLEPDKRDLFAVWAGSAAMLGEAAKYVQSDPTALFPVKSRMAWDADVNLGKLPGKASGCFAADFGGSIGPCAVVLSEGGDQVYQAGSKAAPPAGGKVKLGTASKVAATGDFDGDGRIDLASWDGKTLTLALQTAEGNFAARRTDVSLPECLSLEAVDTGTKGSGLIAGTARGPVLLVSDGKGGFAARALGEGPSPDLGAGGLCIAADLGRTGRCDVVQVFAGGLVVYAGQGPGKFGPGVVTKLELGKAPRAVVCGDFDGDGRLDLLIAGEGGAVLVRQMAGAQGSDRWSAATHVTGELAYHGNANGPTIAGAALADVNGDGRQGVALFYPKRNPMVFFNRGFACFGLARELDVAAESGGAGGGEALDPFAAPAPEKLKAAEALQRGQAAGTMLDLNGDGAQDLLAVDGQQNVWALLGKYTGGRALGLTVALAPGMPGPVTVAHLERNRCAGMYVLRPGMPAFIGRGAPGVVKLEWTGPDGKPQSKTVMVSGTTRVEVGA